MKLLVSMLAIVALGVVTALALMEGGYTGIVEAGLANWGSRQILLDLVIACSMILLWMFHDASKHQRNPWPYMVFTLFLGSFGPLLYVLVGALSKDSEATLASGT